MASFALVGPVLAPKLYRRVDIEEDSCTMGGMFVATLFVPTGGFYCIVFSLTGAEDSSALYAYMFSAGLMALVSCIYTNLITNQSRSLEERDRARKLVGPVALLTISACMVGSGCFFMGSSNNQSTVYWLMITGALVAAVGCKMLDTIRNEETD